MKPMCPRRLWPALPLLHMVSKIQVGFIQAHWLKMRVVVCKNFPDLTEGETYSYVHLLNGHNWTENISCKVGFRLTSLLTTLYFSKFGGTITKLGHSFFPMKPGIAALTPNFLAW